MVHTCHSCQASKIGRHTKTLLSLSEPPDRRFGNVHVGLVGPLPPSGDNIYLFTVVDRFTRWPEVIPLPNAEAVTCAIALLRSWIARLESQTPSPQTKAASSSARYGVSFTWSSVFAPETAYHPQANGIVERFHRSLKVALNLAWMDHTGWMNYQWCYLVLGQPKKRIWMRLQLFLHMAQISEYLVITFLPHLPIN